MKKNLKFYSIFLLNSLSLHPYPYEYRRLIKIDDKKNIEKVVDLVSDYHLPLFLYSKYQKQEIKNFDLEYYKVSNDLLQYLINLTENDHLPMTILLERSSNPEAGLGAIIFNTLLSFMKSNNFIKIFIADQYRYENIFDFYESHNDINKVIIPYIYSRKKLTSNIKNSIYDVFTRINLLALNDIKSIHHQPAQIKLNDIWKILTSNFLENCFSNLTKKCTFNFFIFKVPNYEITIHVFKTSDNHILIYYGGAHCDDVVNILIKDFEFKIFIDLGMSTNIIADDTIYAATLSHKTWEFLNEKPEKTLQRGPLIQVYTKHPLTRFNTAIDNITTWKNNLKELLQEGMDRYVNFLHAEIHNKTLLEHLMDHGYIKEVNNILHSLDKEDTSNNNLIDALKKFIHAAQQLHNMLQK